MLLTTRRTFTLGATTALALGCESAAHTDAGAGAHADAAARADTSARVDAGAVDDAPHAPSDAPLGDDVPSDAPVERWETSTLYENSPAYGGGRFVVRNNYWNSGAPGAGPQTMWAESEQRWGCESMHANADGQVKTFSGCMRGWLTGTGFLVPGHGLGLSARDLRRAELRWAFDSSRDPASVRFNALWDTYFHDVASPTGGELPRTSLMINQMCVDGNGFYQGLAAAGTDVTLGGRTFRMYLHPEPWAAGNTIQLFPGPTTGAVIGVSDLTFDYAGVVRDLISMGLIGGGEYLTAIHAGWEIIAGGSFTTTALRVAVGDEP